MKRVLIGDNREELVSTLESLLKNWGYRAISTADPKNLIEICRELEPDLMIIGPALLNEKKTSTVIEELETPRISVEDPLSNPDWRPEGEVLKYPIDVFELFSKVQGQLEKIPRRNIRLNVRMPGLYYNETGPCIAEILSLSPEGLFLKIGSKMDKVENISLVLPLIGMQTEVEVMGRVAYRVNPTPENNYMQGMGIEFTELDEQTMQILEKYVEGLLFSELSERPYFKETLSSNKLVRQSIQGTLQTSSA